MNNKGVTLIEVIITVVLLGIVLVTGLNAFSTSRETNNISNKYIQGENIASSIIEQSYNVSFEYLSGTLTADELDPNMQDCKFKLPDEFNTESSWVIEEKSDDKIKLSLSDIRTSKSRLSAYVEIDKTKYNDYYNNVQFVVLDTISDKYTCIIDSIGANSGSYELDDEGHFKCDYTSESLKYFIKNLGEFSYDNIVVNNFLSLNKTYIDKKLYNAQKEIEELNKSLPEGSQIDMPNLGDPGYSYISEDDIKKYIRKTIIINIDKNIYDGEQIVEVDANAKYELEQWDEEGNWVEIIESESNRYNTNLNREYIHIINKNTKYTKLDNLYLMYICLSDDWKGDSIEIYNGTDIDKSAEFNFYLIKQPFDSDSNEIVSIGHVDGKPLYEAPKVDIFNYNPNTSITVYTNTNLSLGAHGIADSVKQLYTDKTHLLRDKYVRLYDINVTIKDNNKNIIYNTKDTNTIR